MLTLEDVEFLGRVALVAWLVVAIVAMFMQLARVELKGPWRRRRRR